MAPPTLNTLEPAQVPQFSDDTLVVLHGSGYSAACTVTGPDGPLATTLVDANQLRVTVGWTALEGAGPLGLRVDCPNGTTNALPLVVRPSPAGTHWVFPVATNVDAWYSTFHVVNPTGREATLTVRYLVDVGATATRDSDVFTLPARQLSFLDTAGMDTGPGTIAFSVVLDSDVPVLPILVGRNDAAPDMGFLHVGQTQPITAGAVTLGITGTPLTVLLANPGNTAAQVTLVFTQDAGATTTVNQTVPAWGRATVPLPAEVTNNHWIGLTSLQPVYASSLAGAAPKSMLDPEPFTLPRRRWDFLGAGGGGWRNVLYLANDTASTFTAAINAVGLDGTTVFNTTTELFSGDTDQLYPGLNGGISQAAWVRVDAPVPVLATGAVLTAGGDDAGCLLANSVAAQDLALLGGKNGSLWRTDIILANPNTVAVDAQLTFILDLLPPVVVPLTLAPNSMVVRVSPTAPPGEEMNVEALVSATGPVLGMLRRARQDNTVLMCSPAVTP